MATLSIRLDALARRLGVPVGTAATWFKRGLISGTNQGRGRGRGVVLSRDEAIEVAAIAMLRRAGMPTRRIAPVIRALRSKGQHGPSFFAMGTDGRTVLLDGRAPTAPLVDPRTGQMFLGVVFDLRTMRTTVEAIVTELSMEVKGNRPRR